MMMMLMMMMMMMMMSDDDDDDGENEDDHYGSSGGTWFVVAVGDEKVIAMMFVSLYVYIYIYIYIFIYEYESTVNTGGWKEFVWMEEVGVGMLQLSAFSLLVNARERQWCHSMPLTTKFLSTTGCVKSCIREQQQQTVNNGGFLHSQPR
jgi:hypothetical protein